LLIIGVVELVVLFSFGLTVYYLNLMTKLTWNLNIVDMFLGGMITMGYVFQLCEIIFYVEKNIYFELNFCKL
jgi:hypothetical protein